MEERGSSYLGPLSEVGGQFQAGDEASLVSHYDDGVNGIELNVSQLDGVRHHSLLAQGFEFVEVEVENVNLERDEQRKEFVCFSLGLTGRRGKQMKKSAQINAGRGGGSVAAVSGSGLSASLALLSAVNRAAPLLICCSHASSSGRCREGKEASLKG